jgi:anti-sigma factor RsiW
MTHEEIRSREIPEAYVRGRLSESERAAFEDHYFGCDECFEQVEALQKFIDGVREAADRGALGPAPEAAGGTWFRTAFFVACAASLALAVLAGWSTLFLRPRLEAEAARSRLEADAGQKRLAQLEDTLASLKRSLALAQPNLPLVMLQASRAAGDEPVAVPASAGQLAFWVEPPPSPPAASYRLEISDNRGQSVETIDGLTRNSHGALMASVPAAKLTPGSYRARLYSSGARPVLVGDYRFSVRR